MCSLSLELQPSHCPRLTSGFHMGSVPFWSQSTTAIAVANLCWGQFGTGISAKVHQGPYDPGYFLGSTRKDPETLARSWKSAFCSAPLGTQWWNLMVYSWALDVKSRWSRPRLCAWRNGQSLLQKAGFHGRWRTIPPNSKAISHPLPARVFFEIMPFVLILLLLIAKFGSYNLLSDGLTLRNWSSF